MRDHLYRILQLYRSNWAGPRPVDSIVAAFSAEITHQVCPGAVDFVICPFWPDPAKAAVGLRLVHGVISAFLLYPANVVSPTTINVVISTLLLHMTHELSQMVVDSTT
jgi:hypothetical protein